MTTSRSPGNVGAACVAGALDTGVGLSRSAHRPSGKISAAKSLRRSSGALYLRAIADDEPAYRPWQYAAPLLTIFFPPTTVGCDMRLYADVRARLPMHSMRLVLKPPEAADSIAL